MDGKCVYKSVSISSKRKKRFCGFKQEKNCEMYCEWYELVKMQERASGGFIDMSEFERGIPVEQALEDEE